jgi:hypothetical protein
MRKLKPNQFFLLSNDGAIGYGVFPEVEWHKREREDILRAVGVNVEHGEELKEAEWKGSFKTVSDKEHAEMIRLYAEEDMGMTRIGKALKRSTRTPVEHIKSHNESVERSGFCPLCKRVGTQYHNKLVSKGKLITN